MSGEAQATSSGSGAGPAGSQGESSGGQATTTWDDPLTAPTSSAPPQAEFSGQARPTREGPPTASTSGAGALPNSSAPPPGEASDRAQPTRDGPPTASTSGAGESQGNAAAMGGDIPTPPLVRPIVSPGHDIDTFSRKAITLAPCPS